MLQSREPKHFWDDCLELKVYIWSINAHVTYKLDMDVSEKVVSGEMPDISHFYRLEWFEWSCFEMKLPHSQMTC